MSGQFLSGVNLIWILLNSESQRATVPYAPFKWCWQRQWATGMLTTLETRFKPELCTPKIMKRPKVAHVWINKTYEQVFNIPSYHGNANWKYTTILSHSVIMGAIRRINETLARMRPGGTIADYQCECKLLHPLWKSAGRGLVKLSRTTAQLHSTWNTPIGALNWHTMGTPTHPLTVSVGTVAKIQN